MENKFARNKILNIFLIGESLKVNNLRFEPTTTEHRLLVIIISRLMVFQLK